MCLSRRLRAFAFPAAHLKTGTDRPEYAMQGLQQNLIDGGGGGYDLAQLMIAGS